MFTLTTYYPYEDNVLDVLARHQIKQVVFGTLQVATLPTVLTGTTTGSEHATQLVDSGATFQTDSVVAGDVVYNSTDGSVAIVKNIDSETQLTCTALVSGSDNLWQTSDGYAIRGVPNQVLLLTADDGGNRKGYYKRNSGNSAWEYISGVVDEARGGTGQTTYAQGDLLYANTANTLAKLAKGAAGQSLRMNSGATIPEWVTPPPTLPVVWSVDSRDGEHDGRKSIYTDDQNYFIFTKSGEMIFGVKDSTSGGDYEERTITSDWADATSIFGIAKIGVYLYVGMYDSAPATNRVYRYAAQDIASGGTLMTASLGTTSVIDQMITDGTDLYFDNNGGDTAGHSYDWEKWTISDTTLTFSADIACGSTDTQFAQAAMDSLGNFYGMDSGDKKIRRFNSSGTLQATQTEAYGLALKLHSFEGTVYTAQLDAGSSMVCYRKALLQP